MRVMQVTDLQRQVIEDDCRRLVARAAAFSDANDHSAFASLFDLDGVLVRPDGTSLAGPAAILAAYQSRPAHRLTRHVLSGTLFSEVSAADCRATSQVTLWVCDNRVPAGALGRPLSQPLVLGEFDDWFRLGKQGWRIARREARFLIHDPLSL